MSELCEWCNKEKFDTSKQEKQIYNMFSRNLIRDPSSSGAWIFDPNDTYIDEAIEKLRSYWCQCPAIGHIFPDGTEYMGGDPKTYQGYFGDY